MPLFGPYLARSLFIVNYARPDASYTIKIDLRGLSTRKTPPSELWLMQFHRSSCSTTFLSRCTFCKQQVILRKYQWFDSRRTGPTPKRGEQYIHDDMYNRSNAMEGLQNK